MVATPEEVKEARGWIADCDWLDRDRLDDLTDQEVIAGVNRHYDGGWAQFRLAVNP